MKGRSGRRAGFGINRGALNPTITVLKSTATSSGLPANPKINDIVIDANVTASKVIYVWTGTAWR